MGEKDITEKRLESFNDVFSDIINVLVFDGEETVKEDQLEDSETGSYYTQDRNIHSQIRDVSKYWKANNVIFTLFGLENQTEIDKDMPFRVIGYDGAAYRNMLVDDNAQRYPVITIVLNFSNKRWTKYNSIRSCLDVNEKLASFISDYKINIVDIAFLSEETIHKFKSDFKIVADYFVQQRKTGSYIPMDEKTKHTWELLMLMSALTKDERYIDTYFKEHREEGLTMCDVVDQFVEKGMEKGMEKGRYEGEISTTVRLMKNLIEKMHISVDEAFSMLGVAPDMQAKCRPLLANNA